MMSFALYAMGVTYIAVGCILLFISKECVAAALFCLTGVTAFGFGVVSDAISSIKRANEEGERRRKERGENE